MITSVKPSKRDRAADKISERKFKPNPIALFVVVSVLIHGIGLVLLSFIERSQPRVQMIPETAPIDFVVVPPEETSSETPTEGTTPNKESVEPKSPAPEKIQPSPSTQAVPEPIQETPIAEENLPETPPLPELPSPTTATAPEPVQPTPVPEEIIPEAPPLPELPSPSATVPEPIQETPIPEKIIPETTPLPELPSPTATLPEPILESLPKETKPTKEPEVDTLTQPEIVTPSSDNLAEQQNSAEILSGSDPILEETVTKSPEIEKLSKPPTEVDEPENSPIATDLPPKIEPIPPQETQQPAVARQDLSTPTPNSENSSIATRLPPKIQPISPQETQQPDVPRPNVSPSAPSSENTTPKNTGAASLLGGNLKRSYNDDGGSSFFNLENNVSQQANNPELDTKQRLDMRNYFAEIQRRVRRNWNPKYALQEYTTVLNFSIQRNGQITALSVRRTSGSQAVDLEALEAVRNSGPFDPLPANFPQDNLNIEFNFNIYIY